MDLVERDAPLAELNALLGQARGGRGALVLLGAEAGLGKTGLLRAFCERLPRQVRVLWGDCDPLTTPRPLGPLHDMTGGDPFLTLPLDAPSRHDLFAAVLAELASPTVMVVEDLHWADDATLDLVRFLGRRVRSTRSVVVASFRDDSAPAALRALLGDLASVPGNRRLSLVPLTPEGVAAVVGEAALDPQQLHRLTGGNPFYVTEVAGAPTWVVPPTVADAVLVRAARCSEPARQVLAAVAESPVGLELDLLEELAPGSADALDECVGAGMLVAGGPGVGFRHEIARLAVRDASPPGRRRRLNAATLAALERRGCGDEARLAHHAQAAGDRERVLLHCTAAGAAASARGAHHAAAAQYAVAVAHAGDLPPAERAELLELWAAERVGLDGAVELAELWQQVVDQWRLAGDPVREGGARVDHARQVWFAGDGPRARRLAEEAVALLEPLPASPQLAYGYAALAWLAMLAREGEAALRRGRQAVALGEDLGAPKALAMALNAVGSAKIACFEDRDGIADLRASHRHALRRGDDAGAGIPLSNIGTALGEVRHYGEAAAYLHEALDFAAARDLDDLVGYDTAWLARVELETGRWGAAAGHAQDALRLAGLSAIIPIVAQTVLARVRVRRGDPGHRPLLDDAWQRAERTGDLQRIWPVAAARAESAWLGGRADEVAGLVLGPLELAQRHGSRWATGELALWAWRAGALAEPPDLAAEPYRLQVRGDWRGAAAAWAALGCPYEEAECLADGDEAALRAALGILDGLGAVPAADRVRARLRAVALSPVPPRPRASTRAAPGQLTGRQLEILSLLVEGLGNSAIATRLFISEKTVDHHVSAVLRKLGARSRGEAAAMAQHLL